MQSIAIKQIPIRLINWIMMALSVGQIVFLLTLYFQESLPLPNLLIATIEKQFRAQGISLAIEGYRVGLDGRIDIRELQIYRLEGGELLAQSDRITLALDLPRLLQRKIALKGIEIRNARLYCPAIYSSSGTNEAFAQKINAELRKSDLLWAIPHLTLHLHNLSVHASGKLKGPETVGSKRLTVENYLSFCGTASTWQLALENLTSPVANIVFGAPDKSVPVLDVEIIGKGLIVPNHLITGPFRFHTTDLQFPKLAMSTPARLEVSSAQLGEHYISGRIFAEYKTDALLKDDLRGVEYLRFSGTNLRTEHLAVDDVIGVVYPAAFPILSGRLALRAEDATLHLGGTFDLALGSGRLGFDSNLKVTELLEIPLLKKYGIDRVVAFPGQPHIRGELEIGEGFDFSRLDFDIRAHPLLMRGAHFDKFTARGMIDEERMYVKEALFETAHYSTSGSLQRDFSSGRFRLLLSGTLFPEDLNPALPDWWDNIWTQFRFSEKPPFGNYDILVDTFGKRLVYIYGRAEAHTCTYSNLEMSRTRLKTYGVDGRLDIFDIEADRPEGRGAGNLLFLYEGKQITQRLVNLETKFNLSALSGLLGEDFSRAIEDFSLTNPPHLRLAGTLFDRNAPPGQQRDLQIRAESRSPLKYRQLPFDWLSFDGRISENEFSFEPFRFGYANGQAEGSLHLTRASSGNRLFIDFLLLGADQKLSLETIGFLGVANERKKKRKQAALSSGILGLQFEANGDPADYLSFKGSGVLTIESPQLARVHLFGGLSRLLADTWIDFTTLKLTRAHGQFELHHDRVTFNPLTFTGTDSTIRAVGDLHFPSQEFDLRVRMSYLQDPTNPIAAILTPIFKPIGEALELKMTGTYRNPIWRFSLAPHNSGADF